MARKDRTEAAEKVALTSQAVVAGALAIIDAEGLEALSIRKLAARLGVTPMAIYWHVRNKDELLDGVAASIFEGIDLSVDAASGWQDQLRNLLESMIGALQMHPSAAILLSTRTVASESGLRPTEVLLDIFRRAGFPAAEATQVARHVLSTVTSLVSSESGVVARDEPEPVIEARQQARTYLESLPPDSFPRLVEAAVPLSEGVDPDTYVAFGLDLLMAGIEAMAGRADGLARRD